VKHVNQLLADISSSV